LKRASSAINVAKIALISRSMDGRNCTLGAGSADDRNPSWWWPQP